MAETADTLRGLLEHAAALERRVAALERRLASPELLCPACGGGLEALAMRAHPDGHGREETWARCGACGYAGWRPRGSSAVAGAGAAAVPKRLRSA